LHRFAEKSNDAFSSSLPVEKSSSGLFPVGQEFLPGK